MPRAVFPMSAPASQAGGADYSIWRGLFRAENWQWFARAKTPGPTVSQAARVLSEHAHAARKAHEATIAARKAEMTAQLQAERDAGLVNGKPRA